jgi:AAA domain
MSTRIDFEAVNRVALAQAISLLRSWFPNGVLHGKEFKIGSIDGEPGESFSVNITTGEWAEFNGHTRKGGDLISLYAAKFCGGSQHRAAIELGNRLGVLSSEPPKRRIVATYPYQDANGELLFEVVRYDPKDFRQRRPDGRGGYIWNLQGIDPVPYRLPELRAAAPDAVVFIPEGEKDVDALRTIGLIATCNPGGAGKWSASFDRHFAGRNAVVLPDNDPAGRKHAQDIAAKLKGAAKTVRLLELPNKDVSDWIAAGGTREAFLELVAKAFAPEADDSPEAEEPYAGLGDMLSAKNWISREIPPSDRLLGDLITTTSRMFLVGRTGLGKTMVGLAMAMGMAFGTGFLNWRSSRPARVLYIDGEMPAELLQQRIRDAARRVGREDLLANLMIYSTEWAEELAARFPTLGIIEPLNTDAGQRFIRDLCTILRPDVVVLDNVQALLSGVQKEEECWTPTLPLIMWLTHQRIGQLWLDHTGHSTERQYGSSTKSWRFDAVGIMSPLTNDQLAPQETAFLLSFDHPGKARRRTPDNWSEFAPQIIRLRDDRWTSEPADGPASGPGKAKVSPSRKVFHEALLDAIAHAGTRAGETTKAAWESECVRKGLLEAIGPEDDYRRRDSKRVPLRRAQNELLAAHWIGIDGQRVIDLTRSYS